MYLLSVIFTSMSLIFTQGIHQYKIEGLNNSEEIDLSKFRGKMILAVNVASKCGYTPQYEDLQKLYEQYQDKMVVIGFPSGQFMGQEYSDEARIAQFCSANYGVTFPMTKKIDVKGRDQHPIYKWLTSKELNGKGDYKVSWNFNKFLIDEEGQLVAYFGSGVNPLDKKITSLLD